MNYSIRQATDNDIDKIFAILRAAAAIMQQQGRTQWDENYPDRQAVENDVAKGEGFVMTIADNNIVAYMAVGRHGEPEYDKLAGEWLSDGKYIVVHRVAIRADQRGKGLSVKLFTHVEKIARSLCLGSLRCDTNFDNVEMLTLLNKLGFTKCGIVHYSRGNTRTERIAFEKML